jgi:hypothetical protein
VQEKRSEAQKTLDLVDGYLKEHAQDEWLISGLAGVEEQIGGLLSKQKEIVQKEAAQETANDDSGTGDKVTRRLSEAIRHSEAGTGGRLKTASAGQRCIEPVAGGPLVAGIPHRERNPAA